nr:hypothetical protein CFP56_77907 [Quercus suber]
MFPTQGRHQSPHQPPFSNTAQRNRPPPKKAKGNPIITRYPPPPGYQGPTQPQAPYQPVTWTQPGQAAYGQGSVGYPGSNQQPYGTTQAYTQQLWPGQTQMQQYPPPGYGHMPAHPLYAAQNHAYPAADPTHQSTPSYLSSALSQTGLQNSAIPCQKIDRQNSASLPGNQTLSDDFLDGNGDPLPPPDPTVMTGNELEHGFDGECYFARHPDEVEPELSLGQILWSAPQPTRRALPGVFTEAELEAIAPRHPLSADEDSVSEYFLRSKREETLLSVRQTDLWHDAKHDLIYKEFPAQSSETMSKADLIETYRRRPDPKWSAQDGMQATSPMSEFSRSSSPAMKAEQGNEQHDSVIELDDVHEHDLSGATDLRDEQDDVLGSLEQALYSTEPHQPQSHPPSKGFGHSRTRSTGHSRSHSRHHSRSQSRTYSRASSVSSASGQKITRPVPLPPVHDQNQEEILAALGVTGEASLVYQTPGPAFGPPPTEPVLSHSRHGSTASRNGSFKVLQVPQHIQSSSYDLWNLDQNDRSRRTDYRASSVHSQQTDTGSDFHPEDNDVTPRPISKHADNRKRGFEDDGAGVHGDLEPTPKPKKGKTQLYTGSAFG